MSYGAGSISYFRADVGRTSSESRGASYKRSPVTGSSRYNDFEIGNLFNYFSRKWKDETAIYSNSFDIIANENYQKIIGLGRRVVPHILKDLNNEPEHWYNALTILTNEDPAVDVEAGDLEACSAAWLSWGRARGLVD